MRPKCHLHTVPWDAKKLSLTLPHSLHSERPSVELFNSPQPSSETGTTENPLGEAQQENGERGRASPLHRLNGERLAGDVAEGEGTSCGFPRQRAELEARARLRQLTQGLPSLALESAA